MSFQFDAAQPHQLSAIEAVRRLLDGQGFVPPSLVPSLEAGTAIVPNRIDLSDEQLRDNLVAVQADNGIAGADLLDPIVETDAERFGQAATIQYPNFSVEMETGTGKTYAYLRTALDLAARYGLRKFIVVVPSVAIREGVLTAIGQMKEHLESLPGYPVFHSCAYDSAAPGQVRNFATSNAVEIMVMTVQAFQSAKTSIRRSVEGNPPLLHTLQAVRPVLILDEPQNLESDGRVAALADMNPILALRYSATHKKPFGLAYRLTPFEAYRRGLVKSIEVAEATEDANANRPYVGLERVALVGKQLAAWVEVDTLSKTGVIKRKLVKLTPANGDLRALTNRDEYAGFDQPRLDLHRGVTFRNGVTLAPGKDIGADRDAVFEAQIEFTIRRHFEKQRDLKPLGIKVLSLFFIDRVASWTDDAGTVRQLWPKVFKRVQAEFPEFAEWDAEKVQASYFASYRTKQGRVTVEGEGSNDKERTAQAEMFNLIMRGKEQLIRFDNDVAFIFSHSALREGWDNPNIFQICTLREVASDTERRQQVGRGMRLAVDQHGNRVTDPAANRLTFVASEGYERFVSKLQAEIEEQYGASSAPPKPGNARERVKVKLRKNRLLSAEFEALWKKIAQRTRYAVEIRSEALIDAVVATMADRVIRPPRVVVRMGMIDTMQDAEGRETFFAALSASEAVVVDLQGRFPLPNLLASVEAQMRDTTPPMRVSRRTLLSMLERLPDKASFLSNPQEFAIVLARVVKDHLQEQLVDGIAYEPVGSWYEQTLFKEELEAFKANLAESRDATGISGAGGTHLYDGVPVDSEVERRFVDALERNACVKLYVKLPAWFRVATPIGDYQPDWAIVWEEAGKEQLYLVRETKGTIEENELRPDELLKIKAGRRHFASLGADYKLVSDASQLPAGGR